MIQIYKNFFTNFESEKLITYYKTNTSIEFENINDVYSFKAVNLDDTLITDLSKRILIKNPKFVRVQLVNNSTPSVEKMHYHTSKWSIVSFLNDDFLGGDLIIENIIIKPIKNMLVIFRGDLMHRVSEVTDGDRYTLVSFVDFQPKIIENLT
jgi:predicted 2-oxoglutarate/Fe(II)-dependent dioxygenase YbiX